MSYCHLCGGTKNVEMKFHPRAITKMKANLDKKCGTVSGGSSKPAPSPPKPPPPPPPPSGGGKSSGGGSSGDCTPKASLGKCQPCLTNDQCKDNRATGKGTWYCCPYMKKCVETSSMGCYYPIANCRPMCYDSQVDTCSCNGKKLMDMGWAKKTCSGSGGSSSGGGSKPSPPPAPSGGKKDTQSWCPRYSKYCRYRMRVGGVTKPMKEWCPKTCA